MSNKPNSQSPLTKLLVSNGLARNTQQAEYIMIGVIVCSVLLILTLLSTTSGTTAPVDTEEDRLFDEMVADEGMEQ